MPKYPCRNCKRKRVNFRRAKCIKCQMNVNPEVIESDLLRERQLGLFFSDTGQFVPKRLTIFHL